MISWMTPEGMYMAREIWVLKQTTGSVFKYVPWTYAIQRGQQIVHAAHRGSHRGLCRTCISGLGCEKHLRALYRAGLR